MVYHCAIVPVAGLLTNSGVSNNFTHLSSKIIVKRPQKRNSHMNLDELYFYTSIVILRKRLFMTDNLKTITTDCLKIWLKEN